MSCLLSFLIKFISFVYKPGSSPRLNRFPEISQRPTSCVIEASHFTIREASRGRVQ